MISENDFRKEFGRKLNMLRKQRGITQFDLAEELNYSDKAISKWERGESVPDSFTCYKIASYFGVTMDELFSENENIVAGEKYIDNSKKPIKILVPFISMVGVFFIASVVFFIMINIPTLACYAHYPFIYAVLIASIVMTVFSSIWWGLLGKAFCVSSLIWSIGFALFFSLKIENMKYVFIPCLILQIVCVLVYLMTNAINKSKNKK